jgi:SAM-dependent methyltransferase
MADAHQDDHQANIFWDSEGDAWFRRNRERLAGFDPADDITCQMLAQFGFAPKRVLEVGAANGFRLAALAEAYNCEVLGVDASALAVADGVGRYGLDLRQQAAERLDVPGTFDLVITHFLLHWISRDTLPQLVERITHATAPGGLLAIADFHPDASCDIPYHHLPDEDVMTYKRNYGALFEQTGAYRTIGMVTGDHSELKPRTGVSSEDRIAVWLLEKR